MPNQELQDSQTPQTPQTPPERHQFILFPHLPVELRLAIWSHALHIPRTHFLTCDGSSPPTSHLSQYPPHPLLSTSHESRHIALQSLSPAFGTFVNFASDVLFVTSGKDTYTGWKFNSTNVHTATMRLGQDSGMRRLAVPLQLWKWRKDISSQPGKSMCGVKGVEELILWGEAAERVRLEGMEVRGEEVEFEQGGSDFTGIKAVDASVIDCDEEADVRQVLVETKELDPEWRVPKVSFWVVTLRDPAGIEGVAGLYDGCWVHTGGSNPILLRQFEAHHPRSLE